MTREEITAYALKEADKHKCVLLELATGAGKTRMSIECVNHICDQAYNAGEDEPSILILVAKIVHKNEWLREIKKWGGLKTSNITIECYESLKKHVNETFEIVLLDEVHHLSEAREDILKTLEIRYNLIGLSATISKDLKSWFAENYDTKIISMGLSEAIESSILPDPTIYLIPLYFDSLPTEYIHKNAGKGFPVVNCNWSERWNYLRRKDIELVIRCTKFQYLADLNSEIDWYKKKTMGGAEWAKNKWMRLCNDRLHWLSYCKNTYIWNLLQVFKNYRTITFCASIDQAEILGKNCIHSQKGDRVSQSILNAFNEKKIKHLTAVNILNEGCNLTDCKIGIFANINASNLIMTQRLGRILRHKNPVIIIPYYKSTREEELLNKHLENYNKDLIKVVNSINQIKL